MQARIRAGQAGWLDRAMQVLENGGLVAFPTDTVYGLGCKATDAPAIQRIFQVKGRRREKAIPVLLGDGSQLTQVAASIPPAAQRLGEAFWPGAVTLIVPRRAELPKVLGPNPTLGVRVPAHGLARELLRRAGPMAVTSANPSGGAEPLTADDVESGLVGQVDLLLDGGAVVGGVPSTVVDCTVDPPRILRAGPVTLDELRAVVSVHGLIKPS